jgi:hypothetical protein
LVLDDHRNRLYRTGSDNHANAEHKGAAGSKPKAFFGHCFHYISPFLISEINID